MKVTDYSVIILRKDGSFTYETIKSTEECGYVLLATHNCCITDEDDFSTYLLEEAAPLERAPIMWDVLKAYMVICDDKCVKCRWLDKSKFLFMDSNESHYNFHFEE